MILGAIFGFVIGLSIMFFEDLSFVRGTAMVSCEACKIYETKGVLNKYPKFFSWIMLFVIHTSATVGLGVAALGRVIERSIKRYSVTRMEVVVSLLLVLMMMVISSTSYVLFFNIGEYYLWPETPLNHQWEKIIILLAISVISASISVLGLILTGCSCIKFGKSPNKLKMINQYFELKEEMEKYLLITGFILSSGIVTAFFLVATEQSIGLSNRFDIHALTMFGLLFTIFIVISFMPCRILLFEFGRRIVYVHMGVPPKEIDKTKEWLEANELFEKFLQLKFDLVETIKISIPVVLPVLSAFISAAFPK
jgi:hypothetical protein